MSLVLLIKGVVIVNNKTWQPTDLTVGQVYTIQKVSRSIVKEIYKSDPSYLRSTPTKTHTWKLEYIYWGDRCLHSELLEGDNQSHE